MLSAPKQTTPNVNIELFLQKLSKKTHLLVDLVGMKKMVEASALP